MVGDYIESAINQKDFKVFVRKLGANKLIIETNKDAYLVAFLLKRLRLRAGLSLADVAKQLGAKSRNAYAQYEQGRAVPTVTKLRELLDIISPKTSLILQEV